MAPKGVLSRHALRLLSEDRLLASAEEKTASMRRLRASSSHSKKSSLVSKTAPLSKRLRRGGHLRHVLHQQISSGISREAAEILF